MVKVETDKNGKIFHIQYDENDRIRYFDLNILNQVVSNETELQQLLDNNRKPDNTLKEKIVYLREEEKPITKKEKETIEEK